MQELEEVGGTEELEKEVNRRTRLSKGSWMIDLIVHKTQKVILHLLSMREGDFFMYLTVEKNVALLMKWICIYVGSYSVRIFFRLYWYYIDRVEATHICNVCLSLYPSILLQSPKAKKKEGCLMFSAFVLLA